MDDNLHFSCHSILELVDILCTVQKKKYRNPSHWNSLCHLNTMKMAVLLSVQSHPLIMGTKGRNFWTLKHFLNYSSFLFYNVISLQEQSLLAPNSLILLTVTDLSGLWGPSLGTTSWQKLGDEWVFQQGNGPKHVKLVKVPSFSFEYGLPKVLI